jgi:hypothetical protein
LNSSNAEFGDRVAFAVVYIKEAHPEDGWVLVENRNEDIEFRDAIVDALGRAA